jgi:hypothetical protein
VGLQQSYPLYLLDFRASLSTSKPKVRNPLTASIRRLVAFTQLLTPRRIVSISSFLVAGIIQQM